MATPGEAEGGPTPVPAAGEPVGSLARPLQVPTAVDEVTDRLVTAVAIGEFVPGERLPVERALAQMLGVGRSTVHEAMHRLREAGLVEIRRGRHGGAFVRSDWTAASGAAVARTLAPRREELEQLFDLRGLVEGMVARTAAERRTTEDIRRLKRALTAFARARTPAAEHDADAGIHRAITDATRNAQVVVLTRGLLATMTQGLPIEPYSRHVYDRALQEHTLLVEAVVAGEVDEAGRIAERHFGMTAETLRSVLGRGLKASGS
jgi:GntR family transcriptional regulator, transcriptional repressor for pyruvate dehydrogenase complex